MGIIVNDGRRRANSDIRRLTFAAGTPYHTVLEPTDAGSVRVMSPVVARLLREVLAGVVERGTARRLDHAFVGENGVPLPLGGKTGSGDNRFQTFARGGRRVASQARSRTGVFVFYLGRRWFGVISASVPGPQAEAYAFTSSLPVAVLKLLAPTLSAAIGELERKALYNEINTSMAIFSLQQLGWSDRAEQTHRGDAFAPIIISETAARL
jgi:hypothetical protein